MIKLQDEMYRIEGKFTRPELIFSDGDINFATILELSDDYQSAISNAPLKTDARKMIEFGPPLLRI